MEIMKTEFTKTEWFRIAKLAKPDITREEYNIMWAEFAAKKQAGTLGQDQ